MKHERSDSPTPPTTRTDLVGQLVCFGYEHRFRLVLVDKVWASKAGDEVITGLDEDRNDIRTFRVDRIIRGKVRVVG